jgi:hypothetical protein
MQKGEHQMYKKKATVPLGIHSDHRVYTLFRQRQWVLVY